DLLGYANISNQMLADTGDAGEKALFRLFGRAAAWFAEYAFLMGKGAALEMPQGMLNAPGTMDVTRQTAGTVTIQDIAAMTAELLPSSWGDAIWACSPTTLSKVQQISQYFINIEIGDLHRKARRAAGVLSTFPVFITEKI